MTSHVMLMAELTPKDAKGSGIFELWISESSAFRETVIIIGAILLVALTILLWVIFIRKRRLTKHHGRESERGMLLTDDEIKDRHHSRSFLGFGKRRKHRRRRIHSRNPTLAETGGLPPIRKEEPGRDSAP